MSKIPNFSEIDLTNTYPYYHHVGDPAFPLGLVEEDAMIKITQYWAVCQQQVAQAHAEYYKQVGQVLATAKRRADR